MTEYSFKSTDKKSLVHCVEWAPKGEIVAILQIVHGMSEYVKRYEGLAKYLNKYGILVVGHDHIGHGETADEENFGYFGEKDGWLCMIDDVEKHRKLIDKKYPKTKHFILGHSMGSFVTRSYLSKYGKNISGAIVMGTAGTNSAVGIGKALVKLLRKIKGDFHKSKLITGMAFGSYFKRIEKKRTEYDWLSFDESNVDNYVKDKACGFTFTLAGYEDLFNLLQYMNSKECYDGIPAKLPVFVCAGMEDPVGEYGKGPKEFYDKLLAKGCENVSIKLYENMRHEILNETDKKKVYEDVKKFILG